MVGFTNPKLFFSLFRSETHFTPYFSNIVSINSICSSLRFKLPFFLILDFYLNYRPECPYCGIDPGDWKFDEILEVRSPLSGEEKDLFSLAGGINELGK